MWDFAFDWVCDQGVDVIAVFGDLEYDTDTDFDFKDYMDGVVAGRAEVLPVAGNHDVPDWDMSDGQAGRSAVNPYGELCADYPSLFMGRPYYAKDFGAVRFVSLVTNADTTVFNAPNYEQSYAANNYPYQDLVYWQANGFPNGNPSGSNGDMFGITSSSSPQYQFAKAKMAETTPVWKIVLSHRGPVSALNTVPYLGRGPLGSLKYGIAREFCTSGVDLWCSGDAHVVSLTKRVKTYLTGSEGHYTVSPSDSLGIHYFQTTGPHVRRTVDTSLLPTGSSIFATGGADSAVTAKWVYFSYGKIRGDRMEFSLYRTAQGPSPGYALRIVKVLSRVFMANGRQG
jgi:hypothetical protein